MILLNAKAMQGEWGNILASYHFPLVPYFELKTFVRKKNGNIFVNILRNKLGNMSRKTFRKIFRNILSGYRASWEKPR